MFNIFKRKKKVSILDELSLIAFDMPIPELEDRGSENIGLESLEPIAQERLEYIVEQLSLEDTQVTDEDFKPGTIDATQSVVGKISISNVEMLQYYPTTSEKTQSQSSPTTSSFKDLSVEGDINIEIGGDAGEYNKEA